MGRPSFNQRVERLIKFMITHKRRKSLMTSIEKDAEVKVMQREWNVHIRAF